MKNWKNYQITLLLSAFAFKILILGSVLTLATHNICLDKVLKDDINWTALVGKQRKRNDTASTALNTLNTKQAAADFLSRRICLSSPAKYPVLQLFTASGFTITPYFSFLLKYIPEKIFLRHCSLLR